MSDALEQTGLTILGGIIAGAVGVLTARWQRRFEAKNEFRVFISVTKGRIPKNGFSAFHNTTKKEIRDAVSRLIPALCSCNLKLVESACAAYIDIDDQNLDEKNEEEWERGFQLEVVHKNPPPKPSDILKARLDRLYESVK